VGVLLPYRIWQRSVFSDYDMADNKAYLESVARSFGYFGRDKRVNTISQSPTATRLVKLLKALMVSLHLLIKWHR
jgi:hypothetical protein